MFIYNLEDIAKKLKIDYEGITTKIEHPGVKGVAREDLLKKYLRDLIPEKYAISSGLIMDYKQICSKQQDFIIHNSFDFPNFFKTQTNTIIPIESVYATIEVKSSLNYTNLKEAMHNIESVRKLKKLESIDSNVFFNNQISPLGFIFAYTSRCSLEKILLKVIEINKDININHQVSIICILDKGIIISALKEDVSQTQLIPSDKTIPLMSKSNINESLYTFFLGILDYLNTVKLTIPRFFKYAQESKAFDIHLQVPKEILTDDLYYSDGHNRIQLKEFIRNEKARKIFDSNPWITLEEKCENYKDFYKFFKNDYFKLIELNPKLYEDAYKRLTSLFGYDFDPISFKQFEHYHYNYTKNNDNESRERFDKIICDMWEKYNEEYK